MKSRKKLVAIGVIAFLVLGAIYYAFLAPALIGKGRVLDAFAGGLRGALGLTPSFGDARFRLFPRPVIAVSNVGIRNGAGKEIARADELWLGLSYFGYVTLKPSVAVITLVRPRMDVAPGDLSFDADGKAAPFRGTVRIRDGFLRYAGEKRTVFLDGLDGNLRCKADWGRELEVRGKAGAKKISLAGLKDEASGGISVAVEGRVVYRKEKAGGRVIFDQVDFLLDRARLRMEGEVQTGAGEKEIDLTLRGKDMALKHVLPALAPRFAEAELNGSINLDLTVRGKWGGGKKPEVRGTLTLSNGELRPDDGDAVTALEGKVRFEGIQYIVDNVSGQSKYGGFKARGRIAADDRWSTKISVEGTIPLETLALALGLPPAYEISGPAQLDADVDTELADVGRTTVDGTVTFKSCTVKLKPFAHPFRDLKGTVYCDGYKLQAGKIQGKLLDNSFELGGSWEGFQTPRVEFVAVADNMDLDAALPQKKSGSGKVLGAAGELGLPGKNPVVRGGVRFKTCKILRLQAKNLEADFDYAGGVLNISRFAFDAYEGKTSGLMTVYPRRRPSYTCNLTVKKSRLGLFLTENKYLENVVTGNFSADVVFSAEGTTYEDVKRTFGGKGSVELAGGRVAKLPLLVELAKWSHIDYFEPLQITTLWALAEARDGRIRTTDLRIENADMVINAAGEIGLDKRLDFKVTTTFEKKAADRLARDARALALVRDADGKGHFNFVVTGEAGRPAFQLDTGSMLGTDVAPPGPPGPPGGEEIGNIF